MGYITCGQPIHRGREPRCCWRCEKCPVCSGEFKRVGRGDYCPACTREIKAQGAIWSDYYGDYVKPEDVNIDVLRKEEEHIKPVQEELFNPQRRLKF